MYSQYHMYIYTQPIHTVANNKLESYKVTFTKMQTEIHLLLQHIWKTITYSPTTNMDLVINIPGLDLQCTQLFEVVNQWSEEQHRLQGFRYCAS